MARAIYVDENRGPEAAASDRSGEYEPASLPSRAIMLGEEGLQSSRSGTSSPLNTLSGQMRRGRKGNIRKYLHPLPWSRITKAAGGARPRYTALRKETTSDFEPNRVWGIEPVMHSSGSSAPNRLPAEWIRRARAGSDDALGRVLEECRPYLLLVANKALPPELRGKAGASDLVQDTFLQAQAEFGRFRDESEEELLAWLRAILLNKVANLKRHYCGTAKRRLGREVPIVEGAFGEPRPDVADAGTSPGSQLVAEEEDAALARALDHLSAEHRDVIAWRNFERLSFEEIGRRLGRSAGAARKLWVRAVERLQALLDMPDDT